MQTARQTLIRAKIKIVLILFCALPLVFSVSATHVFAAVSTKQEDISTKPVVAVKIQKVKEPAQQAAVAQEDAASCAPAAGLGRSKSDVAIQEVDKGPVASDIGSAASSAASENLEHISGSGSNRDLAKDKLELSLESRPDKIDTPQSCKPE